MAAPLFNGNTEHFSQERLCNQAGGRVPGSCCCHWATIPANEMLAFTLLECGRTAEFLQNRERRLDPLLPRFPFHLAPMQRRNVPAHFTHTRVQFGRRHLAPEHRQHQIEQRPISLRENLFGLRGKSVECMWLPEPRLDSSLLDETVAFQTEKMSANRVIGELERGCQFIHGLFARPQLLKNSTPRAFQQSLSPTSVLHSETVRPAASKSKLWSGRIGRIPVPLSIRRSAFAVRRSMFTVLLFAFCLALSDN
jgi:hypothetical protein